ncbi:MAG: hypothetical protein ACK4K9_07490 [Bacteroidia bacterium]
MKFKLLNLLLIILFFSFSCKKDLDFNKFNKVKFSPEIGMPIADLKLKITDAIKEDSLIKFDPDGFIRLVYKNDSLAYYPADSLVSIKPLNPEIFFTRLGAIDVGDIEMINSRNLNSLASGFNPATAAAISSIAGTTTIFPAINDQNTTLVNLPNLANADFVDVSMSQGFLKIELINRLPVVIDEIRINIFNIIPFQTLLGQIILNNIPPNQKKSDSINLANKTLSTSLGYNIPVFKTLTSPNPVFVNLNDSIVVLASSSNLKAIAGNAVFPNQDVNPQEIIVPVVSDDPTIRIKHAIFEEAKIFYNVQSTVKERMDLTIKIPGAVKNGVPLAPTVITVNNNTVNGSIDISNTDLDMGLLTNQPYNNLKVIVEPKLISSNQIRPFDSSDFIDAYFTFSQFEFKGLDGYLGSKTLNIDKSEIKLDAFKTIGSGLKLVDTKLRINTQNSIGLPVKVNIDAEAEKSNGAKQPFNGLPFTIAYPTVAQKGQTISGTFEYNRNNSSIVDFIGVGPEKISFGGSATVNADGFTGYNDFIDNTKSINVGFELEAPFNLRSEKITLQDSIKNPFFEIENDRIKDSSVLGLPLENVDLLEVLTRIENAFPFDGGFTLYFADENNVVKDSVEAPVLFESSIPDANGRTQTKKVTISGFKITGEQLRMHYVNNLINTIVSIKLNTYQNGTVPVKLYTDYETKVGLSAKVKAKISAEKK